MPFFGNAQEQDGNKKQIDSLFKFQNEIDKKSLAEAIIKADESLTIAPIFTTNKDDNTKQYIDVNTINLSYKNNALFYIYTHDYISIGVTIEDYNNSDIFIMHKHSPESLPAHSYCWCDNESHPHCICRLLLPHSEPFYGILCL